MTWQHWLAIVALALVAVGVWVLSGMTPTSAHQWLPWLVSLGGAGILGAAWVMRSKQKP